MDQGFVQLSEPDDGGKVSENFWPSFTDIMMVVVMIFLIASVVLIMRNWELVRELRATMEAERRAAEIARSATETSATLEEQLAQAESQLSLLRMRLMQVEEQSAERAEALTEAHGRIRDLEAEGRRLTTALKGETRRAQTLEARLSALETRYVGLEQEHAETRSQLESALSTVGDLESALAVRTEELAEARAHGEAAVSRLAALEGEYETLKGKYEKLIKPARTARGKHVVEVRYEKVTGRTRIRYREQPDRPYQELDAAELHRRLALLKEKYPRKLYVKIVIPENSGLSYNEAWRFTKEILQKYDYYYQEH
ncbi:MAG TPA: hypothetical protein ENK54_02255 [Thiotrichales bacterium]|nr:hypothetical protein [Thiotrichales bacterium]